MSYLTLDRCDFVSVILSSQTENIDMMKVRKLATVIKKFDMEIMIIGCLYICL